MVRAARRGEMGASQSKTQGHQAHDDCRQHVGKGGSRPQQLSNSGRKDEYPTTNHTVDANGSKIPKPEVTQETSRLLNPHRHLLLRITEYSDSTHYVSKPSINCGPLAPKGAVKKLKLIKKRGSPLPNAGEGLGVRGNSTTHLSLADACLARVFDLGSKT